MMKMTQRVRIPTGLQCNARCAFCYYNEELNTQTYTTAQVRASLEMAKAYGIRDIDFSGGEPTVRSDLPELVAHARALGFRRISVITNGTRTGKPAYLKSLCNAGLNDLLVSLHGGNAKVHDDLTGVPGSFTRILQTFDNANALNIRLRVNTVVNRRNMARLDDIAAVTLKARPITYNMICFNDWVNAGPLTRDIAVSYAEAAPRIKAVIDVLSPFVPRVSVRYIPFCLMRGYERHVCNLAQKDYDSDEWIDSVKRLITDHDPIARKRYFEGIERTWQRCSHRIRRHLSPAERQMADTANPRAVFEQVDAVAASLVHKIENTGIRSTYRHGPQCSSCAWHLICDGVEPSYAEHFSLDELEPAPGAVIDDPMYFRRAYLQNRQRRTG